MKCPTSVSVAKERISSDRGSVLVLTMGLVVVAAMVFAVVIDIGVLARARQEVLAHADAAAIAATQAVDMDALIESGYLSTEQGLALPLDADGVGVHARAHTRAASGVSRLQNLRVREAYSDGVFVAVVMTADVTLPFTGVLLGLVADGTVQVRGTARARTLVTP